MAEDCSTYLFTSESVTEGHPDKVCDQISDAVLDAILVKETELAAAGYVAPSGQPADPAQVRVACETMATTGMVIVTGEIRTQAYVDVPAIVREVLRDIGYDRAKYGFDCDTCGVLNAIHDQSPDIAQGVDESWEAQHGLDEGDPYERVGAGDQGMMFGYACDETPTLMPMPVYLAHRLAERLTEVRKNGTMPLLRPDGKTQVSVRYEGGRPVHVEKVVVSTQHAEEIAHDELRAQIVENVVKPVLEREGVALADDAEIHVNPTGRFVVGGPMGDAGLTGRKIIVDTYGGMGRHGGGAFSGKDCTKVDRSAAYAARYVAKNIVAAGEAGQRDDRHVRHERGSRGRHHGRGGRDVRSASGRHHRRARPAPPHLPLDGRLRPLRPRASRVHVGAHRQGRRAAQGLRPGVSDNCRGMWRTARCDRAAGGFAFAACGTVP